MMSSENPYAAPSFSGLQTTANPLPNDLEIRNVKADLNDILSYSIKVWKENLGLLVGATAIIFGISIGMGVISGFGEIVLKGGFNEPPNAGSTVFKGVSNIVTNLIQVFLGIGNVQLLLALLRGRPATIGMLFNGGERFLPALGVSILLGLAVLAGIVLLIIPGIIVALFYWPAYSLVVDRKTPVMQSFSLARVVTIGNEVTSLLIMFLSIGIVMLGLLALCVGLLFAQPLAALLFSCAYLTMSGQLDPRLRMSPTT
jgi:hypothetical protein